jgi:phthalate 4,5-dioxygenase
MLSKEDNELITRTGTGTPMGELMRRYWVPALLSEEIPAPDSPPVQVRLMGEDLVAFRDSQGRIGLLEEHCPHRGTSLFYGRSEESGLRCIYHGWKMDVEGHVLETPAEPATSTFGQRVRQRAYPTHEVNGIIWAYLGPADKQPLFPNFEWTQVPAEQTYVTKCLQDCNYLQGLEGECDSAHLNFLHRSFVPRSRGGSPVPEVNLSQLDSSPIYSTEDTDFGVRLIALRNAGEDKSYVRVSTFLMPVGVAVPVGGGPGGRDGFEVHFYVPAGDDEHSWRIDFGFRRSTVITDDMVHRRQAIGPDYRRYGNVSNHYFQDRERQRTENFTGMTGEYLYHDSAATESMGAIYDRRKEHLGASDMAVIAVRRFMLDAIKGYQRGEEPPCLVPPNATFNDFRHAESTSVLVDGADWHPALPHLVSSREELAALQPDAAAPALA